MNSINNNEFMWTKEAVDFIMADLEWKAIVLETRLKSPFPLLFYYVESNTIEQPEIQPQPIPSP
jgi:hypothetical protein